MKIAGIVTEYNPFHNGHKYHIEEARRVTGADYIIAVMSGNFVQRGTPAIIDKYSRTLMALNNGVDIVLELPVCYATGSAEYFATGAAALLDKLGIVDTLCFGSECGDIALIEDTARLLIKAPEAFDETLLSYVKEGYTYPAARAKAAEQLYHGTVDQASSTKIFRLLSEPNNILGLEYVKALNRLSSPIKPITIQRQSAHYHDTDLGDQKPDMTSLCRFLPVHDSSQVQADAVISSATAIRGTIQAIDESIDLMAVRNSVPQDVYDKLTSEYLRTYPITEEDFSPILKYKLLAENKQSLTEYVDINGDLADRITNIRDTYLSISELSKQIKTRNVTHTRINRALTHLLLNITKAALREYTQNGYVFYARVLGLRRSSSHLLKAITSLGNIPVITKLAKADQQLDPLGKEMLSEDIFATHIYNQAVYEKFKTPLLNEYKHGIIIL